MKNKAPENAVELELLSLEKGSFSSRYDRSSDTIDFY